MSGFLFAFLACLLASLGARDQLLVAQMSARQGARPGLLIVALAVTALTCAAAAWLATTLSGQVPGSGAKMIFAGIALVLAGGEALLLGAKRPPEEPTQSLFAAGLVIAAQQVTDAVRFMVLALALLSAAPVTAALGAIASGAVALATAWTAPEIAGHPLMPRLRRIAGAFLLLAGLLLAWRGLP
ncbi:hypothetical protein [Novosphingobium sp. TH158]|uniref:hypothetical protein n=1 Tax=Novosphingobium sp. TH158 TaxID=2067455 RepID=UPI000C7AEAA4|nr:hypothetical protein [Novosphingobium sp. TH158]PLK27588.1 hypothetical protein C0V78_12345 [Novosphingobium sp. TH158]